MAKPKLTGPQRQRKAPKRGKRRYTVSDAVRRANKLNAQRTRRRKTLEGLKASSMNALKHARYAKTDVLPGEDALAHREKIELTRELLGAESDLEREIAKIAAQAVWDLERAEAANRDVL